MDVESISVRLTREERAALYETATRECRRPEQQIRFVLRKSLGLSVEQPTTEQTQSGTGGHIRQDLSTGAAL